jgi:hypothetical protein
LLWIVALSLLPAVAAAQESSHQSGEPPASAAADPARASRIRTAMARLAAEPAIELVQEAAMRHFRLESSTIDGLRSRATSRALLPTVTVSGDLSRFDRNRTVDDPLVVLQTTDLSDDNALSASASLEWELSETIFNPAELQTYALVGYQVEVLKEVTRLYFIRQQVMLSLLVDPPADPRARAALELRVAEFTSLIDSYTGGQYRRMLRRARRT